MSVAGASKGRSFFREVCRCLPSIVEMYDLGELITASRLRSIVGDRFRENAAATNPQVIDLLVWKGREELEQVLERHKNRHHMITEWIVRPEDVARMDRQIAAANAGSTHSTFLKSFLVSNQ